MTIKSIPTIYRNTWFASTLEADWAATMDRLGWAWQYEPEAVRLADGRAYRPDFYLPAHRVWCEVKGPHNERLDKADALQTTVTLDDMPWASPLVVVLRPPGTGDTAVWEGAQASQDIVMVRCPDCGHDGFMDYEGVWSCRLHLSTSRNPVKFWLEPGGDLFRSGQLPFTRAPRPGPRPIGELIDGLHLKRSA